MNFKALSKRFFLTAFVVIISTVIATVWLFPYEKTLKPLLEKQIVKAMGGGKATIKTITWPHWKEIHIQDLRIQPPKIKKEYTLEKANLKIIEFSPYPLHVKGTLKAKSPLFKISRLKLELWCEKKGMLHAFEARGKIRLYQIQRWQAETQGMRIAGSLSCKGGISFQNKNKKISAEGMIRAKNLSLEGNQVINAWGAPMELEKVIGNFHWDGKIFRLAPLSFESPMGRGTINIRFSPKEKKKFTLKGRIGQFKSTFVREHPEFFYTIDANLPFTFTEKGWK